MKHVFLGFSVRKKVFLWSGLLALFLFLVFLTSVSYIHPSNEGILEVLTRYHFESMFAVAFAGVLIGAGGIYLFSSELQKTTSSLKSNTELLLSFLSPKEKEVLQLLVEKNGQAFQADISKIHGMTRLKAHRIVSKLAERKIVAVNSYGKANLVTLSPNVLKAFNLKPHFENTGKE